MVGGHDWNVPYCSSFICGKESLFILKAHELIYSAGMIILKCHLMMAYKWLSQNAESLNIILNRFLSILVTV